MHAPCAGKTFEIPLIKLHITSTKNDCIDCIYIRAYHKKKKSLQILPYKDSQKISALAGNWTFLKKKS